MAANSESRFRRARRHSRKIALWLLGAFVASQIALSVVIDQHALAVRDPEYVLLQDLLRHRIAEQPGQPVAVFVGSSRVAHGFDAARARGDHDAVVFNFGMPGSGPYFQTITLDRLSAAGIRPDIVFLELLHPFYNAAGPRSLDHSLLDGARLSADEATGLLHYGTRSRTGPLRRWALARALPIRRHHAELRDALPLDIYKPGEGPPAPFHPIDEYGHRPREIPCPLRGELIALAHRQYDPYFASFRLDPAPWGRLLQAIDLSRSMGADVVVVAMPEGTDFRRLYTTEARDGVADMIRRLRDDARVTVVDAREWVDDSGFWDHHHLCKSGAGAFADRFRSDVLEPALGRRAAPVGTTSD